MWRVVLLAGGLGAAVDVAAGQEDGSPANRKGSQGADTSVLHEFEKSIQPASEGGGQNNPQKQPRESKHDEEIGSELGEAVAQEIVDVAMSILAAGGRYSLRRLAPDPDAEAPLLRNDGEPLIPFIRYDFGYQWVSANIAGHIHRFEGGYGPVALFLEDYTLDESSPGAALNIQRQMMLYRMSGSRAEIDIGLGQTVISGAQRTEIGAVSLRGRFMFGEAVSMDILPTWGSGLDDCELALHWGRQFGSLKIGYRRLHSPSAALGGPFAGFALYF
jgi:hypothetical protein